MLDMVLDWFLDNLDAILIVWGVCWMPIVALMTRTVAIHLYTMTRKMIVWRNYAKQTYADVDPEWVKAHKAEEC